MKIQYPGIRNLWMHQFLFFLGLPDHNFLNFWALVQVPVPRIYLLQLRKSKKMFRIVNSCECSGYYAREEIQRFFLNLLYNLAPSHSPLLGRNNSPSSVLIRILQNDFVAKSTNPGMGLTAKCCPPNGWFRSQSEKQEKWIWESHIIPYMQFYMQN